MATDKVLNSADVALSDGVRTVAKESIARLAAITADAFRDDPFNNWMFTQQKYKHQMYLGFAKHVYTPHGFCQILSEKDQALAATMWMLPGGMFKTPLAMYPALVKSFLFDDGISGARRGLMTGNAMEAHHPQEPHAYLFTVGVMGKARGRGLGRRLIQPVLDACDRSGTMAYLENSNPANTRFYQSLGFERVAMIEPIPGCPPLEAMQRQAQN
ncbi:MAG: GNAT family N-acetyltransferase [Oceanococcus sp.]